MAVLNMPLMLSINVQWLFVICYFGQQVTRRLEKVNYIIYQSD